MRCSQTSLTPKYTFYFTQWQGKKKKKVILNRSYLKSNAVQNDIRLSRSPQPDAISGVRKGNTMISIQVIAVKAQEMAFQILLTYSCR